MTMTEFTNPTPADGEDAYEREAEAASDETESIHVSLTASARTFSRLKRDPPWLGE